MIELIEKAFLTGMGAVCLGQKKGEELLQEFKERFNVSEEEGKALLTKMQDAAKENQKKLEELAQEEVRQACQRIGMVSVEEFQKLRKKVGQLEKKLEEAGK